MRFQAYSLKRNLKQLFWLEKARGISSGLSSALARNGVVVMGKAFQNLTYSELQQKGACITESLSGIPVWVRGNVLGGASEFSKPQFSKLLKLVTTHLSSVSDVFVHDGAIGLSSKFGTRVRVISDCPSAVLRLSNVLWDAPSRAVSHDSCPLTIYVATSISPGVGEAVRLETKPSSGFMAADTERSSLILCGKAFKDISGTKEALAALSGPIISARGGLLLSGRLLVLGNSVILLFAPEDTIKSCADKLISADAGVILSSESVEPLFLTGKCDGSKRYKLPAAIVLASHDSSGNIPVVSKLSPAQAAYHFLAGYQNEKFVPAYSNSPSIDPLELAHTLLIKLKDHKISSFLVNINDGGKTMTGKDLFKLVESTLTKDIPPFQPKGGDLRRKYKAYLSSKFQEIPKEFSF